MKNRILLRFHVCVWTICSRKWISGRWLQVGGSAVYYRTVGII